MLSLVVAIELYWLPFRLAFMFEWKSTPLSMVTDALICTVHFLDASSHVIFFEVVFAKENETMFGHHACAESSTGCLCRAPANSFAALLCSQSPVGRCSFSKPSDTLAIRAWPQKGRLWTLSFRNRTAQLPNTVAPGALDYHYYMRPSL